MPDRPETPRALLRIQGLFPKLRPSERKVAEYILAHADEVVNLPVTELARRSDVSDATVVKFTQKVGYSGYQEFKIALARESGLPQRPTYGELDPSDDLEKVKGKVIQMHVNALENTLRTLSDDELERAVDALEKAGTIHFYGVGASGLVALDGEQKFLRIGRRCNAFIDPHLQYAMAALLRPGDVAIGITHSGTTAEIIQALKIASASGATAVCITNHFDAPVTEVCDVKLYTAAHEPVFRSAATSSRIAQASVVDILFVAVAQRNYDQSLENLERTRAAVSVKHLG